MLADFLITCSGANKEILKLCPTERTKFVNIGAIVFLTAIMAGVSGGYAIYFTFNSFWISCCFGVFWAIVIFNLDRYIVSSIRKTGNWKNELWTAAPRFLIALVLAITISKPLEIKLFDGTITKKLGTIEDTYNKACETNFINQRNALDAKVQELRKELESRKLAIYQQDPIFKDYERQIAEKDTANIALNQQVDNNARIITANSWVEEVSYGDSVAVRKIRRYNDVATNAIAQNKILRKDIMDNKLQVTVLQDSVKSRKAELANQVKAVEQQYNTQLAGVQTQIADMNTRRGEIMQKCREDAAADKDILARLRALGELKVIGNSIWWASLFITLLFILIETSPVTVKLLAKRGPYDEVLDRIEYELKCEQEKLINAKKKEVEILDDEIEELSRLKMEMRIKTEASKVEAELKLNQSLLEDIAEKTADLAKEEVRKWYEEQLAKMKPNHSNGHASKEEEATAAAPASL